MGILTAIFKRSSPPESASRADLEQIQSDIRMLKLEWSETLDKVTHALDRLSKRQKTLVGQNGPEIQPETIESLWETVHKRGLI